MKNERIQIENYQQTCVCCGAPIPEGRMTCLKCEKYTEGLYLPIKEAKGKKRRKWFRKRD
ncbi:MAG: hypothetical protein J6A78_05170 [Clostridia bacterium]|nr:hypothetical protein [Oscillospiraceae bacterium]MBO5358691.1 hypothetical protein [Clostridia bacterium]